MAIKTAPQSAYCSLSAAPVLSLVRAIIEAHGGTVDVQSEPGHGATVTLRLPKS